LIALYGALGVLAAAQGTMNNFTFGDGAHQYYETICGGSGAGPDFDGTDAVQTHATNSLLTDPEVLEWRFPVLLDSFGIRLCRVAAIAVAHTQRAQRMRQIVHRKLLLSTPL
jgi:N-methylhydantoinase B/oxoprolinase/acetone carboxylase alpha subunit